MRLRPNEEDRTFDEIQCDAGYIAGVFATGAWLNECRGCKRSLSSIAARAREDAMKNNLSVERGSGNVFEDLGFSPGEAENLQLRAQLMSKIRAEARELTQAQAAKRFGVSQPRINDQLRGKIEKFSLEALVNMLAAAGLRVEMRVKKAAWQRLSCGWHVMKCT